MRDAPQHRATTLLGGVCHPWLHPGGLICHVLPADMIAGEAGVGAEAAGPYEYGTGRGGVSKHSVWKDIIRESGQN